MQKVIDFLNGKKTIISAIATAIWTALFQQGVIDEKTFQGGAVAGACLVAVFMRLAIQKQSQIRIGVHQAAGDISVKPGVSTVAGITVLHQPGVTPTPSDLIQPKPEVKQ